MSLLDGTIKPSLSSGSLKLYCGNLYYNMKQSICPVGQVRFESEVSLVRFPEETYNYFYFEFFTHFPDPTVRRNASRFAKSKQPFLLYALTNQGNIYLSDILSKCGQIICAFSKFKSLNTQSIC